jgi:hypothetical protein
MAESLGAIFGELGISQYLEAFLDQGFDSWDTILDITESDLCVAPTITPPPAKLAGLIVVFIRRDALGVKLGHRRVSVPKGAWDITL